MQEILPEILNRRSVRAYKDLPVSDEQVETLLQAAILSPSGHNLQPWRFLEVRDPQRKAKIVELDHEQKWMLQAPIFLVCMADLAMREENPGIAGGEYPGEGLKKVIRDTSACVENLLLQAQHMGLGACWTGWYQQEPMKELLGVPDSFYIVGIITVGYADQAPQPRPRRDLAEVVCKEIWTIA